MTAARPDVLDFLLTRRSRPAKTLTAPVPDSDALGPLLSAAARSPDHGALEPFRFIVLERAALARIAELIAPAGERLGRSPEEIAKQRAVYAGGNLAVAVVFSPRESPKVPRVEQQYTAGAVCLSLLNAALAAGWGANWLSGWASHDPQFCAEAFALEPQEAIAGLIHIGTESTQPADRPRPDINAITTWVRA
ncbi:nitroreductase family protein [Mangrovicoccus algicola]|uniref:Putative NAD(P)H nitroreductase n=1 Tax=Mangrovicoccus algicola TaxID=2771008 RepID=A0A8J6YUD8_9RHOB|nr:nitroreductase family protein [Mangrovicoccus algicola]